MLNFIDETKERAKGTVLSRGTIPKIQYSTRRLEMIVCTWWVG